MGKLEQEQAYSAPVNRNDSDDHHDSLPAYNQHAETAPDPATPSTSAIQPNEHVFDLRDEKTGRPWAKLKVKSLARSLTSLPIFSAGDDIVGSIELDLKDSTTFHSVSIRVLGDVINPQNRVWKDSENAFTSDSPFLDQTQVLWNKKDGVPATNTSGEKSKGKLKGQYSFPFRIKLPLTVDVLTAPNLTETFPVPSHFVERRAEISLNYTLTANLSYGLFRNIAAISKNFGVIPAQQPPEPSPLRRIAYSEGTKPPGPDADPEGWFTLAPVKIAGKLFHTEDAEVTATLSIAKPLVYSRGTQIPVYLILESPSKQALDLVANPESIQICLTRIVNAGFEARKKTDMAMGPQTMAQCQSMAIFWNPTTREATGPQDDNRRVFEGEIKIKPDQTPSTTFWHLVIRYHVFILQFKAAGWVPQSGSSMIADQRVEIVVRHAKGQRPPSNVPEGAVEPPFADIKEWGNLSAFWVQVDV
ncbi:hypothetical protein SISSUDRAFT_106897 [Sistotremastrum suecicum HHB10207 ss-3]|uniref:Arrestin-like N-terminal domain-containing protein n=1 Tax=Sistotremastrum suecicum HHB10207 ss-3 TaxID=1314776 RepID=A0A166B339_9AGAM|nr:hypothetical protein SISSUDRAFT_106897 [Sistotremastrum suecicum HHB10207 ss-3]